MHNDTKGLQRAASQKRRWDGGKKGGGGDAGIPRVPMRRVLVLEGASGAATATTWPACSLGPVRCFLKAGLDRFDSSTLKQTVSFQAGTSSWSFTSPIPMKERAGAPVKQDLPSSFRCGPFKLLREAEHLANFSSGKRVAR